MLGISWKSWAWLVVLWGVVLLAVTTRLGEMTLNMMFFMWSIESGDVSGAMDRAEERVQLVVGVASWLGWGLLALGGGALLFLATRRPHPPETVRQDEDEENEEDEKDEEDDEERNTTEKAGG